MKDARERELDDAFLGIVRDWAWGGIGCDESRFNEIACELFAYQLQRNSPYARFAAACGIDVAHPPRDWHDIPAVPATAFKDAILATSPPQEAELVFHTSGTTTGLTGRHYLRRARLYDASLLAAFDRFMLADRAKLRYFNLVPSPRERPHSSLSYMVGQVSVLRGDGAAQYFVHEDRIDIAAFQRAAAQAIAEAQPLCIMTTAFALSALLDELESLATRIAAPAGSRIMETGGFKGRARTIERAELYARAEAALGIPDGAIVAEYGMTELVSQYYDAPESRGRPVRLKRAPPWLRTIVVDGRGRESPAAHVGFLRHVDLGNSSSVVAVQTEDRGYACGGDIVLLGRDQSALPRGCSLDAEQLMGRLVGEA